MPAKKKEQSVPLILYPILIVLVILYIVFTILTLGIFLPEDEQKKQAPKKVHKSSEEEQIRVLLERKQNRERIVAARITELELIKRQITRKERRILFLVRLIIASGLLAINWFYLTEISRKPFMKECADEIIGSITNLNALILLGYTLPAYILYGTVGKFTAAMKRKITLILKKEHIPTLSELQLLKTEETQLRQDIHQLKLALERVP